MPASNFLQSSFLGGEWAPLVQGRMDLPKYKTGLNVCRNVIPIEQGAMVRRSGTREIATTRDGDPGRLIPFTFQAANPYTMEFTDGHLRLFAGTSLVLGDDIATVLTIDDSSPAQVFVSPVDWATGDTVQFMFTGSETSFNNAFLRNRQFKVTMLSTGSFTMSDPVTGDAITGAEVAWVSDDVQVAKVVDFDTVWTDGAWADLRSVQSVKTAVLLTGATQPQRLDLATAATASQFATFTLNPAIFYDGPYLDPVTGAQATPSGLSGSITLTFNYQAYSASIGYMEGDTVTSAGADYVSLVSGNVGHTPASSPTYWAVTNPGSVFGPDGAQATDVNRLIRLLSEPPLWSAATPYSPGDPVAYNGAYYSCLVGNTGVAPDQSIVDWQVNPYAATWAWGTIIAVASAASVTVALNLPILYVNTIRTFRLGLYSDSTGWPTCGTYFQGRLWLGGAVANRFDASVSNNIFVFSPTAGDGTVADNNAISYTFNSADQNTIYWMQPIETGILCGTLGGEWMIKASQLSDPLTPTSIQAHRVTKYGSANIEPRVTGLAALFVQKFRRRLLEGVTDTFSGKFSAPNLSFTAQHLTAAGIAEIAYQEELAPVIWTRYDDGTLTGTTYRRTSAFSSEEPTFSGWHRHDLGSGRLVRSICTGPAEGGALDALMMTTEDEDGVYHVERMANLFWEGDTLLDAWFLDSATTPTGATYDGTTSVTFSGLHYLDGETVACYVGGIDAGDFVVSSGTITVPLGGLLTQSYITSLGSGDYGELAVSLDQVTTTVPAHPSTNGTIQDYDNAVGWSTLAPAVSWGDNLLYLYEEGIISSSASAPPGIWSLNLTNGANVANVTGYSLIFNTLPAAWSALTAYVVGNQVSYSGEFYQCIVNVGPTATTPAGDGGVHWRTLPRYFQQPLTLGTNGNLYYQNGTQNYVSLVQMDRTTLQVVTQFGIAGASGAVDYQHYAKPISVAAIELNGHHFLVTGALYESTISVYLADAAGMGWAGHKTAVSLPTFSDLVFADVCIGSSSSRHASAFAFVHPYITAGASTTLPIRLYETVLALGAEDYDITSNTTNAFITTYLRGSVTPEQVDPTWETFSTGDIGQALGATFNYDPSDGNVIVGLQTLDSVTNPRYLVKLRASDAKVLWACPVSTTSFALGGCNSSVISGGVYVFIQTGGTNSTAYAIDTATGASTTFTIKGVSTTHRQTFDSQTGMLLALCNYDGTVSGAPAPQNSTPASFSTTWASINMGGNFQGDTTSVSSGALPVVIGFPFTSQAQLLRNSQTPSGSGPDFAKSGRVHMFGALMETTVGVSFGTNFTNLRPADFKTPGGTPYTKLQPYSGLYWNTIEDDYSFDGRIAWQVIRPYPVLIAALGGFEHTADR